MKRVTGSGGTFFKAQDQEKIYQWYEKHLGIQRDPRGEGCRSVGARPTIPNAAG
jgi:hypothetical protein